MTGKSLLAKRPMQGCKHDSPVLVVSKAVLRLGCSSCIVGKGGIGPKPQQHGACITQGLIAKAKPMQVFVGWLKLGSFLNPSPKQGRLLIGKALRLGQSNMAPKGVGKLEDIKYEASAVVPQKPLA